MMFKDAAKKSSNLSEIENLFLNYALAVKILFTNLFLNPNLLEYLSITERDLQFPYYRLGNLIILCRTISNTSPNVKDHWVKNSIESNVLIHVNGVVYADISLRGFLVAEGLSIKLRNLYDGAKSLLTDYKLT